MRGSRGEILSRDRGVWLADDQLRTLVDGTFEELEVTSDRDVLVVRMRKSEHGQVPPVTPIRTTAEWRLVTSTCSRLWSTLRRLSRPSTAISESIRRTLAFQPAPHGAQIGKLSGALLAQEVCDSCDKVRGRGQMCLMPLILELH